MSIPANPITFLIHLDTVALEALLWGLIEKGNNLGDMQSFLVTLKNLSSVITCHKASS